MWCVSAAAGSDLVWWCDASMLCYKLLLSNQSTLLYLGFTVPLQANRRTRQVGSNKELRYSGINLRGGRMESKASVTGCTTLLSVGFNVNPLELGTALYCD